MYIAAMSNIPAPMMPKVRKIMNSSFPIFTNANPNPKNKRKIVTNEYKPASIFTTIFIYFPPNKMATTANN